MQLGRLIEFLLSPHLFGNPVLLSIGHFIEFDGLIIVLFDCILDFIERTFEKLAPLIHEIQFTIGKSVMQCGFKSRSVVCKNHCMYVEVEGHRCITEFVDAIHGLKPASHADVEYIPSERADIRDDVDIASARIRFTIVDIGDSFIDLVDVCS